jgi:RNA polymerase sigma-70 factor (ECF subfamily)
MQTIVDSSDGDLARAVAAREAGEAEAAESELYRRFGPRVRLYGLRHLGDEDSALDLMQQVMLTTIEKLRSGSVRDVDQIASFVFGVTRSMVKDQKRLEWRREKLREAFMFPDPVQAQVTDARLDVDSLERCLGRLAARERMVVLMTFYAEQTAGEVARELGVKEGNVRVIRHRAVERLRTCMTSGEVAQ